MASDMSPYKRVSLTIQMHLPPSTLGDVRGGITEVLNRKLMAYDDAIGGAMLSYSNMTLRKRQGMMFNELPNILFDVSIDAMVFCPRKGCALSGTVNKVSRNHVGILVGGVFNASVSSDDMHEGLSYDSAADAYKHPASDCAVFIANLFMLGFMVEQLVRGRTLEEECEYPLWAWLIVQVVLVVLLQIMAPLCLVVPKKPHLLSPVLSLSLFLLQWMWLMVGWVWALSPSDCETQAPFNFSGAFWTVIVYSVAVPMEILWYMRIYVAFWQTNPKGCDCPCAPAAINDLDV
eukprot:g2193.t1